MHSRSLFASLSLTLAASLPLALAACGAPDEGDAEVAVELGKDDSQSSLPAPGKTAGRLYFHTPVVVTLDADHAPVYHVFTSAGGQSFHVGVEAITDDGDGGIGVDASAGVGFKLYRLAQHTNGKKYWKLLTQADGEGTADADYDGWVTRWYMVETSAGQFPTDVRITVTCTSSALDCALAGQPGDTCGAHGDFKKCDTGTYCEYPVGSCGHDGSAGQCTIAPAFCPPMGVACFPVCGCDGQTYCRGCAVTSARKSIAHDGACGCDTSVYSPAQVDPSGTWKYIDPSSNTHFTYTFSGKLGFTSLREPGCLFSNPQCKIAVVQRHGGYSVGGADNTITLTYDDGAVVVLDGQKNCTGAARLVGTDYSTALLLTPAP